ncbi:MAG: TerB family tellurite resistance protein [Flavobacteriales bacterium]|nr:TerB family tellurite resistance protein [Flavobacteriales bacterium]MCB9197698.1 TerB family tellurite resistance protein [Flavobacteriales bacterium]
MSIARYFESGETTQDKGHVKNLVLLAKADGHVSDEELVLIHRIGRHVGLTYGQIGEIIDNPHGYPVIPPVSKIERLEHMAHMVDVIQIDGVVDQKELNLLSIFAVQIGFKDVNDAHVNEILELLKADVDYEDIAEKLA